MGWSSLCTTLCKGLIVWQLGFHNPHPLTNTECVRLSFILFGETLNALLLGADYLLMSLQALARGIFFFLERRRILATLEPPSIQSWRCCCCCFICARHSFQWASLLIWPTLLPIALEIAAAAALCLKWQSDNTFLFSHIPLYTSIQSQMVRLPWLPACLPELKTYIYLLFMRSSVVGTSMLN